MSLYYNENRDDILEHKKQYYKQNKTQIIENKKKYYTLNRDKIIQNNKRKILCDCGSVISYSNLKRHFDTMKHQNYLLNNQISI